MIGPYSCPKCGDMFYSQDEAIEHFAVCGGYVTEEGSE